MMSKPAVLFLLIAFLSGGLLAIPDQAQWLMAAAKITLAVSGVSPVSYTHLTLPTIYSV